jgi:hypothetical protein
MNRNYDFTIKEKQLLDRIRFDDSASLNELRKIIFSEIQEFYWEESIFPVNRTFYYGIMFAGVKMQIDDFLKLRVLLFEKGFFIYKSDEVITRKFLEFHYFGYQPEKVPSIPRECYYIIPKLEKFDFLEKIVSECGEKTLVKKTIEKWKIEYSVEVIWFDNYELLLYFTKIPNDIDAFYKDYFEIVGCSFVYDVSDEERKQRLIKGFPMLYIYFKSL